MSETATEGQIITSNEARDDIDMNLELEEIPEAEEEVQKTEREEKKRAGIKELRRRQSLVSGIRPIYNLAKSDEFGRAEIFEHIGPWIEKNAASQENIAEILKYFELAKEIISSEFPPDRRAEVICALAEILAEGHMDAETLATLVSNIEPENQDTTGQNTGSGYEGIAFFREAEDDRGARITLTERFFEQGEAGERKFNLAHMLKHEVGHGLLYYGEVLSGDEIAAINSLTRSREAEPQANTPKISAEVYRILDQAESDRHLQTHHLTTVLESYEAFKRQEGVTEAQLQRRAIMATNEIMAEKIGLYLSSNGEFVDFLRANIEVTSDENLQKIFATSQKPEIQNIIAKAVTGEGEEGTSIEELQQQCPELMRFIESNKVFFDLASERLADKEKLKQNIKKNVAISRELDNHEEDFFGYYGDGFYEPATPVHGNDQKSKEQRGSFWQTAIELAGAIGEEVGATNPITELNK